MSMIGVWALYLKPTLILSYTPQLSFNSISQSIDSVLPIYPKTRLEAFDYGVLVQALASYSESDSMTQDTILRDASLLAGRSVTVEEMMSLRSTLVEIEGNVSIIQKVWGFFSFINLLWLMAIAGIAISFLPAMWSLAEPLLNLLNDLAICVKRLVEWFVIEIIIPSLQWLHDTSILEAFSFTMSFLLTAQGLRMQPESGMYVTISGLVALIACPVYSYYLHGQEFNEWIESNINLFGCTIVCALVCPMALHFQSVLLAYLATAAFWHCLGFTIIIEPFCYCIGWKDEDIMLRCASTSGTLLQVFTAAKITRALPPSIGCFESPVAVLGSVMLFLCLLCMSCLYYPDNRTRGGSVTSEGAFYIRRNVIFLLCALIAIYIGNVFQMNGLANTATTFLVLWMLEKYCEIHFELKLNIWVLILLLSGVMYKLALWLHANPAFVASLFTGFD